ncbi:MAG: hypothetical protein Q4B28_05175 [bacterium]|nr:hypothetical protein [bacterium]
MKNFLLPWLNKENESLTKLPNNPLNKLQLSSSFNTPNGGFLGKKAPITPIPHTVPITPVPQTSTNPVPMTPVPQHILPQMPK